jgi:hypothetical protein
MQLECAGCGFPVVDDLLQWRPGLHVTGPLAELEVGPASRNIVGARLAGERLRRVPGKKSASWSTGVRIQPAGKGTFSGPAGSGQESRAAHPVPFAGDLALP